MTSKQTEWYDKIKIFGTPVNTVLLAALIFMCKFEFNKSESLITQYGTRIDKVEKNQAVDEQKIGGNTLDNSTVTYWIIN